MCSILHSLLAYKYMIRNGSYHHNIMQATCKRLNVIQRKINGNMCSIRVNGCEEHRPTQLTRNIKDHWNVLRSHQGGIMHAKTNKLIGIDEVCIIYYVTSITSVQAFKVDWFVPTRRYVHVIGICWPCFSWAVLQLCKLFKLEKCGALYMHTCENKLWVEKLTYIDL